MSAEVDRIAPKYRQPVTASADVGLAAALSAPGLAAESSSVPPGGMGIRRSVDELQVRSGLSSGYAPDLLALF